MTRRLPDDSTARDEDHLACSSLLGSRSPGARRAADPSLGQPGAKETSPPITS
ncbi:hypothetical protein OG800_47360 [Streptomyces sp. NBC_00445]|uniref:hypothetical protein n=1 Tax=Streptomyces sp. NBC_00445 TaxID=2975745 RepID=UPI002E21676A